MVISPRVYFSFRSAQLSCFLVQGSDEFLVRSKRAVGAAFLIVLLARSDAAINRAALRWRVLIIRRGKLGQDSDHATRHFNFDFLPALETGPPEGSRGNLNRLLVFNGDGHSHGYRRKPSKLSFLR